MNGGSHLQDRRTHPNNKTTSKFKQKLAQQVLLLSRFQPAYFTAPLLVHFICQKSFACVRSED